MKKNGEILSNLSPHLFWDVKTEQLDIEENKGYIIKRVLEYGLWEDWLKLKNIYGLTTISEESQDSGNWIQKPLLFWQISRVCQKKNSDATLRNSRAPNTGTFERRIAIYLLKLFMAFKNDVRLRLSKPVLEVEIAIYSLGKIKARFL